MIALLALLVLLQTAAGADSATVGDTIWVARTVPLAARQTVRPADWEPADPVELVGRPAVTISGATAEIRYPVTVWRAGRHRVEVPGPLLLGADGVADSLPPQVVTLEVASVLPPAPPDSALQPQPRAGVVSRRGTTPEPLLVLLAAAALLSLVLRRLWWRRGKPLVDRAAPPPPAAAPVAVSVERWVEAGEWRAVASLAAARLRDAVARRGDGAEVAPGVAAELERLLAALDRTRFGADAGTDDDDALALCRRAARLEARLGGAAETGTDGTHAEHQP